MQFESYEAVKKLIDEIADSYDEPSEDQVEKMNRLTGGSWTAENLREYIKAYITKLYDYTYQNKFPGTTTSSTIMLLEKRTTAQFSYIDVVTGKQVEINKSILGKKWKFTETKELNRKYRFGDYFQVNNTIATLYNKAFVLEEYTTDDKYYLLPDGYKIEAELVKPAVSRKRGKKSHEIAIIFPYYYESGILYHYTEDEFKEKFPQATGHLMRYKENLEGLVLKERCEKKEMQIKMQSGSNMGEARRLQKCIEKNWLCLQLFLPG